MNRTHRKLARAYLIATAMLAVLGVVGCGTPSNGSGTNPVAPVVPQITGHADGGQGGISGATVQLYAVGNTGNKSAATPLLMQSVVTGSTGDFTLTGLWSCTNSAAYGTDPLLYIVVSGGTGSSLAMMTAIGPCSGFAAPSNVYINEVTTVAAVYALAPFMADRAHIGASAAFMSGLKNSFATAAVLANTTTGVSPGTGVVSGETVPSSQINSLANTLAPCINAAGAACSSLFAATAASGIIAVTNTIDALLQTVSVPSHNVPAIFALGSSTSLFAPKLTAAPADWALMLKFMGSGISGPAGIAIDAGGNAWIANSSGSSITGLSPQGSSLAGTTGYSAGGTIFGAQAIAVDRNGNIWVADTLVSKVFKLIVASGTVQSSVAFTAGINGPTAIAVDPNNNIWVANFGDGTVTELNNAGTPINGSPLTATGTLQAPASIAVDRNGRIWVTDNQASVIAKFDTNGAVLSGPGFSDGALLAPLGIALDSTGRAMVVGNGNSGVSIFANDGTSQSSSPITGGGLLMPSAVSIDGAGSMWIVDSAPAGGLTQIPASLSAATGGLGTLNVPMALAIDASGNIWTVNAGDDSISKFVGLAAPVVTPLAN